MLFERLSLFITNKLFTMKKINALIMFIALIGFVGCQQSVVEDTTHAHTHASKSYTLFSENLELFAEIDAFTKGHGSNFAIHLTNLKTYKPIESGKVTISIKGAQTNFSTTIDAPETPGIYHGKFVAKSVEKVTLTISYQGAEFNEVFDFGHLAVFSDDHEAEEAFAASAGAHSSEEIIFTKEQAWEIDFATLELIPQDFKSVIPVSGKLEALPTNMSSLIAPTEGIVRFVKNLVPGQKVKKGEILFTIDAGQLTSNNLNTKYNSANVAYEKAKSDLERAENLVKDNIISDKDFREIKLEFDKAKIEFETIAKNFSKGRQTVKANQSGIISDLTIMAGNFVNEGQQMGKIISLGKLLLHANLPQSNYDAIEKIASANFKTAYSDKTYSTLDLNGKLISISKTPSEENGYISVYFEIDNPGELTAGLFTEIFLEANSSEKVIFIPISALIEKEGHYHVYVQEDGEGYMSHDVTIGSNNGLKAVVKAGLKSGDRLVTKGAYRIKLASMSGELPTHGHVH
jgi:membrane fusion protein, heavy metal efflux system